MLRSFAITSMSALLGAIALAPAGCTFGGIADYEIEQCKPASKQTDDVCDRLNAAGGAGCLTFQCDPATLRCVERTRDDDRDGDPPVTCGGTDCDDADPLRSAKATETCDLKDNNCDGVVDEGAITPNASRKITEVVLTQDSSPTIVPGDVAQTSMLAAFVKDGCISVLNLQKGLPATSDGACSVLQGEPAVLPHQPYPIATSEGVGAAMSASGSCAGGRLAYRFGASKLDPPCDPSHGVALPAVAFNPQNANANSGVIAWYDTPYTTREAAVSCASLTPAKLAVLRHSSLKQISGQPFEIVYTTELAAASRPPAMLAIEPAQGLLLATPLAEDVGLFFFNPSNFEAAALPPAVRVPSLAGARSTSLAMRVEGAKVTVALAAQTGCTPQASIKLALGTLENGALTFSSAIDVAPSGQVANSPSVAWNEARSEWWVGWIDDAAHVHIQRLAPDGKAIGPGIVLDSAAVSLGQVSSGESVFALTSEAFVEVPLDCAR